LLMHGHSMMAKLRPSSGDQQMLLVESEPS
jgi:hypothetical protein